MPRLSKSLPKYRKHRSSGHAIVFVVERRIGDRVDHALH
ncbi:MAG: hypothetical protein ACI814_004232 [Mariniblastus sp.]|jgi:hypothetical protein